MKNIDSFDGFETRALFSTELTCVPPLWNHPKTVGVAQAILPVQFSGVCKTLLETVRDRDASLAKVSRSIVFSRSNFCRAIIVRQ